MRPPLRQARSTRSWLMPGRAFLAGSGSTALSHLERCSYLWSDGRGESVFGSGIAGFGAMFRIDGAESGFAARFLSYFAVFPCFGAFDEEAERVLAEAFEGG